MLQFIKKKLDPVDWDSLSRQEQVCLASTVIYAYPKARLSLEAALHEFENQHRNKGLVSLLFSLFFFLSFLFFSFLLVFIANFCHGF